MTFLLLQVDEVLMFMVRSLLDSGASIGYNDSDGNTALSLALHYDKSEQLLQLLLQQDVDRSLATQHAHSSTKDDCTSDQGSLLDLAMRLSQPKHALMLLQHGVLPTEIGLTIDEGDDEGFDELSEDPHPPTERIALRQFAALHGYERTAVSRLNRALLQAVEAGDTQAAKDVIVHGADLEVRNALGETVLYRAIRNKQRDETLINSLLDADADVNAVDDSGTPMAVYLLIAGTHQAHRILARLCQHGLNVHQNVPTSRQSLLKFAEETSTR